MVTRALRRRLVVSDWGEARGGSRAAMMDAWKSSMGSWGGRRSMRQRGQVPEMLRSQGSTQRGWNLWLHGKTRTSSPRVKSSVQMEQLGESSKSLGGSWFDGPAAAADAGVVGRMAASS